jgi:hypothetical protein
MREVEFSVGNGSFRNTREISRSRSEKLAQVFTSEVDRPTASAQNLRVFRESKTRSDRTRHNVRPENTNDVPRVEGGEHHR